LGSGQEGAFGLEFGCGHAREPRIVSWVPPRSRSIRFDSIPKKTGWRRYQRPRSPATELTAHPVRHVVTGKFGDTSRHPAGRSATRDIYVSSGP
jgi:hypothetical protein